MKKAVTFRLHADLLAAARDCAAREHRTLTNFIEVCLRERIGEPAADVPEPRRSTSRASEGSTLAE